MPIEILESIKSLGITNGTLANEDPIFYDVFGDDLVIEPVDEFSEFEMGQQRVSIKGNPNFGDIRTLMVGVKNPRQDNMDVCGSVWFNELRLSDMDNEGGWAAILTMDANIADFMSLSATGRQSTSGFGSIEQGPNEREIEDKRQYDLVPNINIGQLLPKKWEVSIPFNFGLSEELITPEYDQQYKDIKLQNRLNSAEDVSEKNSILERSEDYTKRKSINFIGVNKQRSGEKKERFYDLENLTLNYSYNQVEHRDYEIEDLLDQNLRAGAAYNFNFNSIKLEPFKKNDSLFTGKYFKILKDLNFNLLPTNISINTDFIRQFNKQKFRDSELTGDNISVNELFRRNYNFDLQYNFNYAVSDALNFSYNASNNNIVKNYFIDDNINGEQDSSLDVFDRFFDIGDPNMQSQQFAINYELPLNKIPTFSFITASYSYTGDFQWQKGSDLFGNLTLNGETYDLGNTISNANTHNVNSSLDMSKLYKYIGLVKKNNRKSSDKDSGVNSPQSQRTSSANKKFNFKNTVIDLLTSVKRVQLNYSENNGSFLPGYLQTPDFIGSFKPSLGYVFGSQRDIRYLAAKNGWLTVFPDFNQQYTQVTNKNLTFSANLTPIRDLKIDLTAGRTYSENLTENFNTIDENGDGLSDDYNPLIQNTLGNFNISTVLIKTAFSKSDENSSDTFDAFRENRLVIARRLALDAGIDFTNANNFENADLNSFPLGYGKTNQSVLLPAFLSAYTGDDPSTSSLGAFRNIPIPNWTLKYTGLMKLKWFKKNFKRLSISHGYNAMYTINQFRSNLDYNEGNPALNFSYQNPNVLDQSDNYKNEFLYSNINLMEQFSPLFKLDFEMKNSIKILAEVKKDRLLSLSFDNNLLTEIQGNEYIFGFGYRVKDLKIRSSLAGASQIIKSDLNMKLDLSIRNNKTIIRYLDLDNNQVTSGQTIWNFKYSADYDFSRNLTGIFYFDYSFSEYAISTAFPQTTIRSGFTMRYNFGN